MRPVYFVVSSLPRLRTGVRALGSLVVALHPGHLKRP